MSIFKKNKQPKLKLNTKWTYMKLDLISRIVSLGFRFQIPLTKFTHVNKPDTSKPFIIASWHAHQCAIYGLSEVIRRVNILISPSNDGQIISDACSRLGFKIIRGSKGRRGASKAVMQMYEALQNGDIVSVMIDGPKGPNHVVQPGAIELAKLSGKPIIPMVWYSPAKNFLKFNSWDEFRLPIFYCRVVNLYGDPIYVSNDASDEEFEQKRLEVERKLEELYADLQVNCEEYLKNAK